MGRGRFTISARHTWYVVCKDCLARQKFDDVETAGNWMDGHERECIGTHR